MYISDETLEIIAQHFRMDEVQTEVFIQQVRENELDIIWKSIFIYFEENKSGLELEYIQKLLEKFPQDKQSRDKFVGLLSAEAQHNPELMEFCLRKVRTYIANIIVEFAEVAPEEVVKKLVESLVPEAEKIKDILKSPPVQAS